MTSQPIRNKNDLKLLAEYFLNQNQTRNYLLIILGVYTALRISDLLLLRWSDVYDFQIKQFKPAISLFENKTGKFKRIALNEHAILALKLCLNTSKKIYPNSFLFDNGNQSHLSRVQAWRIITKAVEKLEINEKITCHSLRKTFGYHAWKDGLPVAVIVEIYNHSSLSVTKRYLGITQDDIDHVYTNIKLLSFISCILL